MSKIISKTCNFGEHLTIDGYLGNPQKLDNRKVILKCLNQLPGLIKMKKLGKPQLYKASANFKKDPGGWSGFVIVAESHISIHTFPRRRFVSIDVYTCKNGLKRNFIINYFKKAFGLKEIETYFIKRGKHYLKFNII